MTAALSHRMAYRRMVSSVRVIRREMSIAQELQRRGKTLREIAEYLGVPVKSVHQSLYWDVVRS